MLARPLFPTYNQCSNTCCIEPLCVIKGLAILEVIEISPFSKSRTSIVVCYIFNVVILQNLQR